MDVLRAVNLGVRLLLELGLLAAISFWGWDAQGATLAVVLPLVAGATWATFIAPKARILLPGTARLAIELGLFGLATAGLVAGSETALGTAFAALVVANELGIAALGQRSPLGHVADSHGR